MRRGSAAGVPKRSTSAADQVSATAARAARSYTTALGRPGQPSATVASARVASEHASSHFTFVPGATAASNVQSTALPSTEPASTIPFDSTPMSFAGFRFATSTIVFPTSASGS